MNKLILIPITMVGLMGCAQMRMPVPKDLAGNPTAMPVTIKKTWHIFDINKISFGPFAGSKIHQGWDKTGSLTADVYSASDFSKNYSFILKQDNGSEWKCECGVKAAKKEVKGKLLGGDLHIPIKNKVSLNCSFKGSQSDSNWTLDLSKNANETDLFTGELSGAGNKILVESIDEIEGQRFNVSNQPSGYVYKVGGSSIGAVDVLDKQKVWITPDSTGKVGPELALSSTALILFQDVLKSVDKEK